MPQKAKELNDSWINKENIENLILPHYNIVNCTINEIKFKDTEKQRAVYKVDTENKSFCLKKVYLDKRNLLFVYSAMQWLYKNNLNVPILLPTTDGSRFVEENNMLFILTPWVDGTKCDFDNKKHLYISCSNLAKVHIGSKNFKPINGSSLPIGLDDLYVSYNKHFQQILNCSNLAFKHKDNFSKLFLKNFDENLSLAKLSVNISNYMNKDNLNISLCHNDYVNKNLIFTDDENIHMIDFDKCKIDFCVKDLSYFFRRLLKRDLTNWDFDLFIKCLNHYESINPLNLDEYKFLSSYLIFPQKFWRISRDYYNNIKCCNKKSFYNLLKNTTLKTDSQVEFSVKLIEHIESKFNCKLF